MEARITTLKKDVFHRKEVNNMDSEEQKALNDEAEQINLNAPPPLEESTEEVPTVEAEVATEAEPEVTETEERSKGAQARIRELNTKAKEAEARADSLAERLAALTGSVDPAVDNQPFNPADPIVAPGEEIDVTELNRRIMERDQKNFRNVEALITLKQKQSDTIGRINSEAIESMRVYPELDPDSESYNEELSDTIAQAVEAHVKADPYNASVKKFTDKLMKPYKGAIEKSVGQVTENLAKQVSETALRPTSIRKTEKTANEKSIQELEAELGIIQA